LEEVEEVSPMEEYEAEIEQTPISPLSGLKP